MTKKSAGRVARDLEEKQQRDAAQNFKNKPNAGWDDLKKIYTSCCEALVTANASLADVYKTPGITANVPDHAGVIVALRGLDKDLRFFADELVTINARHADRNGDAVTDDDSSLCLQIFEQYYAFETRYQSVILPTVIYLAEQAGLAHQKMVDFAKTNDLLNPNVVSDISVKEPSAEVEEIQTPVATASSTIEG